MSPNVLHIFTPLFVVYIFHMSENDVS